MSATTGANQNLVEWHTFVAGLTWERGSLDESSFMAAQGVLSWKIPPEIAQAEIERRIEQAGDSPNKWKIASQIRRAGDFGNAEKKKTGGFGPKSRFCPEVLKRIADKLDVADIRAFVAARSAFDPKLVTSLSFLRCLYKPTEKVLVFTDYKSQGQALWPDCGTNLPASGKDGVWYLANPVDGRPRRNKRQQTISRRSEESIRCFRFAVVESDEADLKDWLKCLAQMPLRIAAIYESGGRSIHALLQIDAATKDEWDEKMKPLKPTLITVGACRG